MFAKIGVDTAENRPSKIWVAELPTTSSFTPCRLGQRNISERLERQECPHGRAAVLGELGVAVGGEAHDDREDDVELLLHCERPRVLQHIVVLEAWAV